MGKKTFGIVFIFMLLSLSLDAFGVVDHIRFGSTNTPLEGVTVTWRGYYSHCTIKWGYTTEYEQETGKTVEGRMEFGDRNYFLYDYTFRPLPLKPSTVIHFAFQETTGKYDCLEYRGNWTKDYTFRTSTDVKSEQFTFIAGGDSRGDPGDFNMEKWGEVAEVMKNTTADFYLYMGDIALQGGDKLLWESWYKAGKNFLSRKLIYHSAGNHERYGDPLLYNFLDQFVLPENGDFTELYYSFEFGNAVFITLNTEFSERTALGRAYNEKQNRWLLDQLKKYRGPKAKKRKNYKEWIIISFHKPFFTIDYHMGEMTRTPPEEEFDHDFSKTWWKDLFDKYGVDVILNGHTHTYMRSEPILLVKTGPGGKDITFDCKGLPSEPVKKVVYGNKKDQGRLQIVTGGYGVKLKTEEELEYKDQWYVNNYKREFHYCEFRISGKVLNLEVKRIEDGEVIDRLKIEH